MSFKNKHHTKESRKKMSKAHIGIELSNQHKRKIGQGNQGKIMSEQAKQKISEAHKGKKISEKHKRRIGLAGIGNQNGSGNLGNNHTEYTKRKMSKAQKGEKGHNWKGGITPDNKRIRKNVEFRLWRQAVFARDNWICQKCQERGNGILHPHHIYNFANYPKLRFVVSNGITFCEKCHREFHQIYKYKNNKEQLNKFLSNN